MSLDIKSDLAQALLSGAKLFTKSGTYWEFSDDNLWYVWKDERTRIVADLNQLTENLSLWPKTDIVVDYSNHIKEELDKLINE